MSTSRNQTNRATSTMILGVLAVTLVVCVVLFPSESFEASLQGLNIWWKIVFPGLLPFLILAEIAIAYGFFHFIGIFLEPVMRILFRLPGIGGPVMAIGLSVGFPTGAKLTCQLRELEDINRKEGEILLALSHIGSPVLIVNIIAVGFFHNAKFGLFLLLVQWISLIIIGFLLRFYLKNETQMTSSKIEKQTTLVHMFRRAIRAMVEARHKDGRPFGKLLGDAVSASIQTLMMIGGYMMIFSVIIKIISVTPLSTLFYALLKPVIPETMVHSLIAGLLEIHLGSHAMSSLLPTHTEWQMAIIGFLLAFSGLSVHAQVTNFTHRTDLKYFTFFIVRILHGLMVIGLTFLLWKPIHTFFQHTQPVLLTLSTTMKKSTLLNIMNMWSVSFMLMFEIIVLLIGISVIILCMRKLFGPFKS